MTTKRCPNRGCKRYCDQSAKQCLSCHRTAGQKSLQERLARRPQVLVGDDLAQRKSVRDLHDLQVRYKALQDEFETQQKQLEAVAGLKAGIETHVIHPAAPKGVSEATVVAVASDWHIEEIVVKNMVSGLNENNLTLSKAKAEKFFVKTLRLTDLLAKDIRIDNMVVPLLGDFITGNIHGEDNAETNECKPTEAIVLAQNWIASGIELLLNNSKRNLVFPCHSGNHARTTQKTRFGAENGHSLEFLMYHHLAAYFRNEKRVEFIIPQGPHSYLNVYDQTIRFHHGHMLKYSGGVGGLFIPAYKNIAKWNDGRHADLDVFGHFHQSKDGGSFLCNGSGIGYNTYALSIGASFEVPKQTLFLMDKKRGRTCTWPILVK